MTVAFKKLGNLLSDGFQNGLYKPSEKYGSGTLIIRINDYDNEGRISENIILRVDIDPSEKTRFSLQKHDILINRVNSLTHIGKSCLVTKIKEPLVYESNMMRLRISATSILLPEFIACVLQTPKARDYFRKVAKRAVAQVSINQEDVKSLKVPTYEQHLQISIVETLKCWTEAIEKTERLIEAKDQF